MNIYVASSWRNVIQASVVHALRAAGHEVYDFKNPAPGEHGFSWAEIDPGWQRWSAEKFREALKHPVAKHGFSLDMDALRRCDACVLVMPCGRSAHLELGWAAGARKRTVVYFPLLTDPEGNETFPEPELMYAMCDRVCVTLDEVLAVCSVRTVAERRADEEEFRRRVQEDANRPCPKCGMAGICLACIEKSKRLFEET